MNTLNENDFIRLYTFIQKKYGINLSKKKQLIEGRLNSTLLSMGFNDFSDYVDFILTKSTEKDVEVLLNKLTTNYTYFMREKTHFDFFSHNILPSLVKNKKDKVLSVWSAGCSTGQEPYTLSILIKEFLGKDAPNWDTRILATDISQKVLLQAQKGLYPGDSLKDMPNEWVRKYFNRVANTDQYEVTPELKANVIYKTFNLMDPIHFRIPFDVIFCRNVMIYFNQPTKDALVDRFYDSTNPGGYLIIGLSETINKHSTKYKYVVPAVYRKI
ncbi:CheR family methyltransferase [Anaerotignum propionicum]|jgi:chemotaxis protein methyltransferase CheR|uniref:protein-glutamate O-methyltransferase n=1 Tax=Anaerotignum propionicum DSM 1682 TaxID=991789 RepID=A0A0X8VEW4_ANAPI|nr:protein-glutamate O-methyltransferase CheR [Anaerotignum propionicum]AMJ42402.1 chemotaxis protein methyltransferase cher2 [Anaerotignum propionicum DSM 1682]MEA5058235.1 protein-glutamate O-methyltransferase CheR [Anaerotignum propionicum]SHF01258.1 chemotaxis protein methyltransferase CheR [[Clostridium] propionicum DSM 1682] [Anaerotignum propionicum DSM 1682]